MDAADLSLLAGNWQWQRPVGADVREPATALLLGIVAATWFGFSRTKKNLSTRQG